VIVSASHRFLVCSIALAACTTTHRPLEQAPDTGPPTTGFRCLDCLASADCGAGYDCIQYAQDVACAPTCGAGGSCPSGLHCETFSTVSGEQAMSCVPNTPMCGLEAPDGGPGADTGPTAGDAGVSTDGGQHATDAHVPPGNDAASPPMMCGGLVDPTTPACCNCASGHTCDPNNCYGGWWCNTATCTCQRPPTSCGGGNDAGGPPPRDSGTPGVDAGLPAGSVGQMGGTVPRLFFGVLGDTRPAVITSSTSSYPTSVITRLYQDLQGLSPRPDFVVTTGDYCFAPSTTSGAADAQMQLYMGARRMFSGPVFFAMGNHECTGATSSNCPSTGNSSYNYQAFMGTMLTTQQQPYYMIPINATDGSWTAKFIFAAPNSWDSAQQAFLQSALATQTTYTFVIDHEPSATSSGPPGLSPLNQMLQGVPHTLRIVGHTHTYNHSSGSNQVTIGLGGAPLASTYNYGYLTITQLPNNDIEVAEYDYMTGTQNDVWRVHPDGTPAP
jgi:hypothetical protein